MISFRRVKAMALKELFHIWRDPFTLAFASIMPIFLVTVFGTAINFDVKNIPIIFDDRDHSTTSRELIRIFQNTQNFVITKTLPLTYPEDLISAQKTRSIILIEPTFEKNIRSQKGAKVQILIDGADNATAASLVGYLIGINESANQKLIEPLLRSPIQLAPRFLYNPELSSPYFIVPGLAVVVLAIISILLTALTVARDYENGPMELLLSTPARPLEIILGKIFPYVVICLISIITIYFMARFGFHLPFRGNHLLFIVSCLLFLSAYLAQGILISVTTRKQVISMQLSMISGLLPSILLSGFIFPIESMPTFFQYFTMIFPARWFMNISRDLFLKGTTLGEMLPNVFALVVLNILLITLAIKKFKRDLEP